MGYIGVSLLVASVVFVLFRPPPWMYPYMPDFMVPPRPLRRELGRPPDGDALSRSRNDAPTIQLEQDLSTKLQPIKEVYDRSAMPPPPVFRRPNATQPTPPKIASDDQTTPKATATRREDPIPSFTLSDEPARGASTSANNPSIPTPSSSMPPPSLIPPRGLQPRIPSLAAFPAIDSPQRARAPLPIPNRGPTTSSLALPPTHSTKPAKPSRKVMLTPGHSPLDWARISGPNADLRNLPASTQYLKVTPSMLKRQTGRKGKDAWTAMGGRVYNITPYLPYHPGGEPELLRGAGRDGTKLFGEVHPWVNYETMLASCLIGLLVDEDEGAKISEMDKLD